MILAAVGRSTSFQPDHSVSEQHTNGEPVELLGHICGHVHPASQAWPSTARADFAMVKSVLGRTPGRSFSSFQFYRGRSCECFHHQYRKQEEGAQCHDEEIMLHGDWDHHLHQHQQQYLIGYAFQTYCF